MASPGGGRVRVVAGPSRAATAVATGALVLLASVGTSLLVLSTTSEVSPRTAAPSSRPPTSAAPTSDTLVVPPRPIPSGGLAGGGAGGVEGFAGPIAPGPAEPPAGGGAPDAATSPVFALPDDAAGEGASPDDAARPGSAPSDRRPPGARSSRPPGPRGDGFAPGRDGPRVATGQQQIGVSFLVASDEPADDVSGAASAEPVRMLTTLAFDTMSFGTTGARPSSDHRGRAYGHAVAVRQGGSGPSAAPPAPNAAPAAPDAAPPALTTPPAAPPDHAAPAGTRTHLPPAHDRPRAEPRARGNAAPKARPRSRTLDEAKAGAHAAASRATAGSARSHRTGGR